MLEQEQQLIEKAKADPEAFGLLYSHYVDRIYAFAYQLTRDPMLADDLTAMTFEQALTNLASYEWRGYPFGTWLYQIARRNVYAHTRRTRRLLPWSFSKESRSTHSFEEQVEDRTILERHLASLPTNYREVLILRYIHGLPSADVANILSCSVPDVYRYLNRALKKLKGLMMNEGGQVYYVAE